jgi:mannitol 2-dehydrogenase
MVRMLNETLTSLPAEGNDHKKIVLSSYDRSQLQGGILHIGVGNFHRAHMAAYQDDLFHHDLENHKSWGIIGAGIMHFDEAKRNQLQAQDWLQTLVERDGDSENARILRSMIDFLPVDHVRQEHKELKAHLASPAIKIVSLTVTEGGYFLNDGKFDPAHPLIQHDIQNPSQPHTIFGMMIQALGHRRSVGMAPFTIMSCDNIPMNGQVVRSVVLGLATQIDDDLAEWIDDNVAFPNSMVDRITPVTTDAQRQHIQDKYGYHDAAPIFCEPFRQWVIEDIPFSCGRPAWEQLDNVKFVPNVVPYEEMKIRILNGGHASLCYPAALLGVQYVHEAMDHPTIGAFLDALECQEIIPTVPPVPDTKLNEYWNLISSRFANPTIGDTITRICYDGASRQPKFIVPVAADALEEDHGRVDGLALVSALWCRYCQGKTEAGEVIPPNDPQWDRLQALALQAADDSNQWLLGLHDVYGKVGENPTFQASFRKALTNIQTKGVEAAMKQYIASSAAAAH